MTRNLELVFVFVLFALAIFVVFPFTTKFTNCFAVASGRIQEIQAPPQVSKEIFCKNGQEVIVSLNSCINGVKKSNGFAPLFFRLAFLFPQIKNIASTIDRHNQVCPDYPVNQFF